MATVSVEYRDATEEDIPEIFTLVHAVRGSTSKMRKEDFIVACVEGKIVGCVRIKETSEGVHKMSSLAVDPNFRMRGIDVEIVSRMLEKFSRRPVYVICFAEREQFYMKNGFYRVSPSELPLQLQSDFNQMEYDLRGSGREVLAMIFR